HRRERVRGKGTALRPILHRLDSAAVMKRISIPDPGFCALGFRAKIIDYRSGPMPSVYIKTYGCQMNERDSEAVAAQLVAKGYTLARGEAEADVILLNTCSVRDYAEQKALGKMENLAVEVRRNRPNVVLGFMGCMAQSRGRELIDKLPDVDLVLGTQK